MTAFISGKPETNIHYLKRMFKYFGLKGLFEGIWYLWRMR